MRTTALATTLCLLLAGAPAAAAPTATVPAPPTGVVSWTGHRQQIDGFGGAFAFHKAGSIQRLGEPLTSQILDMIFDREAGIGLDIARVMVGDGGTWGDQLYDGPTDTIMPEPGVLVWDQPGWEQRRADFDAHQIWLMRQARARGVESILASVWSPPAWMKENGSVVGSGPDNRLRPDMYQQFADYLAEYVLGYREHFGIEITHISPTNEPDVGASYSSSRWTPEELNVFVRDYLGPTFEARDVPAEIVLGEAVAFSDAYARPALTDPVTAGYLDVVAAHAYAGLIDGATAPDLAEWSTALAGEAAIWQTEYMNQGAPRDRLFVNNTITDGLRYATLIGNLFDRVRLNAYFWWWPASNSGADGSNLIRLANDGSPQSGNPTETGQYRVFKRYYAIGNYSRFVEPGWVMLEADPQPAEGVTLTAYRDPGSDSFAVVAVNNAAESRTVRVALDGYPRGTGAVVPFRTSASENLRRLGGVGMTGGAFTATLPAGSITTFVPRRYAPPALPERGDVFSTYPAERTDGRSPGLRVRTSVEGAGLLTGLRPGSYVRYDNVNFADGSAAGFAEQRGELRMHARVAAMAGGTIEVRLDHPRTGALVGTMAVAAAGDPDACRRPWRNPCPAWSTVSTDVDTDPDGGAYGFHDVYLVFQGSPGHPGMFHVDEFSFSD